MIGRLVNALLNPLGIRLSRIEGDLTPLYNNKYELDPDNFNGLDRETRKVLNLLSYTSLSGSSYNAELYDSYYHAIKLNNTEISGQRQPAERLAAIPFDFTNASVLDIGSNQGGMLFEIAGSIRHGIGLDYDCRMVNVANRIKSYKTLNNIDFFVFDLEKENLNLIDNFLPSKKIDIVFLLSVCMWIENWRDVIAKSRSIADTLLFESNGTDEQQLEQEKALNLHYKEINLLRTSSPDDPGQKLRKLYFCHA